MSRIIRVNMASKEVHEETALAEHELIGGRALIASTMNKEVPASCHPLGGGNKVIVAPGLLSGSSAPCSGRLSIGAKSPLTNTIKEANMGGTGGQKIARLNIKAIVIEGEPKDEQFYILKVDAAGAAILPAGDLVGLGNYELHEKIREKFGKGVAAISIGPAGEKKLCAATIAGSDQEGHPSRHAARGGLGAVLGSKKVKAIVIDDSGSTIRKAKDDHLFQKAVRELTKSTLDNPAINGLTQYGTAGTITVFNSIGALPTRNFRMGQFEEAGQITGEKIAELNKARGGMNGHACMPGCIIRCSNVFNNRKGEYSTSSFEFETIAMFGSNLGISDIDAIAEMDRICDDCGIDTIEMGNTLAVLIEAGLLQFGQAGRAIEMLGEVKRGSALGRVIGQGATTASKVFGVTRVPVVKGQGIPAWEPRALKGAGVTYAT